MVDTTIVVRRGDELGEGYRRRITEVYVRAFADDFVAFSRDTTRLADAFEHMLLLERFYVALIDGEPVGLASLTEGPQQLFDPRWGEFRRHLGLVRGLLCYTVIRTWFMKPSAAAAPGRGEIGFVATEPEYQGRGVATTLLRHLLALPGLHEYVLEDIKDTNTPALAVYTKLGFTEYTRRAVRGAQRAGFTELLSMKLIQPPTDLQHHPSPAEVFTSNPSANPLTEGPVLTFDSFAFRLAVIEELMYVQGVLAPRFDVYAFTRNLEHIHPDDWFDQMIPEVKDWFTALPIPASLAANVTTLSFDGGNETYLQLIPQWDGEDTNFHVTDLTDADLAPLTALQTVYDEGAFLNDQARHTLTQHGITII